MVHFPHEHPVAVSRQPSAVSRQPSAVSVLTRAVSPERHLPRVLAAIGKIACTAVAPLRMATTSPGARWGMVGTCSPTEMLPRTDRSRLARRVRARITWGPRRTPPRSGLTTDRRGTTYPNDRHQLWEKTMDPFQEELDGAFGDGPPHPPVGIHLVAGRRALMRRRVARVTTGLAAATVLFTSWYAVSPGSTSDSVGRTGDPASSTSPTSPSTSQEPSTGPSQPPWPRGELIRYVNEELDVRAGAIVHEHIRNPYGFQPPELSDALDVTWKGQRQWLMIEKRQMPFGTTSSASEPSNGWASFADYVAAQVDVDSGSGWPDTFQLDNRGEVIPTADTRVINRTDDPQLGPDFASPGATTGAAVVSVVGEEGNYFIVWRVINGTLDVITTPPGDIVGATFEELLSGARAQYASGEGLR